MPPKLSKLAFPGPPPKEALDFFNQKKLKIGFNYQAVWQEEHAAAFTVARVMEKRILKTMQESITKAMDEGQTFREWSRDAESILSKSGWITERPEVPIPYRLQIIYDTNIRMARACGQWQRVERTKKDLPYLVYELGPSLHHREEHESWEGTTLPVDDPWWETHYPPSDYGCKCWVRQIGQDEAEEIGISEEAPPSYEVPWENTVTGETGTAPVGVNPGFAYPKGDRMAGLDQASEEVEE